MYLRKIILIPFTLCFLSACSNEKAKFSIEPGKPVQVDPMPGSCPYLTKDRNGNVVMSWARNLDDSTAIFCYAVSSDGGHSFDRPVTIPNSNNLSPHSENLPKIIFKPSGEIIALWGVANPSSNNKYSGLVYYSQSFDEGKTWTQIQPLVSDSNGYDQRYYDVSLLPTGEAAVIWLDNRKKTGKEGSTLYFATTNGKAGFHDEKIIAESCCQCCRTDLYIDNESGIHVLYRGIIKDSVRDMLHSVSVDGGKNFSDPQLISNDNWVIKGCPHTGPAMTGNKNGLHFTWFTGGRNKGCFYTSSADNGNHFTTPERFSISGSHPQVASFLGGNLVTVWDESVQGTERFYKKIGVQQRDSKGAATKQGFITADTSLASYPVVACLPGDECVIAYTVKKAERNYIHFQRVSLK